MDGTSSLGSGSRRSTETQKSVGVGHDRDAAGRSSSGETTGAQGASAEAQADPRDFKGS